MCRYRARFPHFTQIPWRGNFTSYNNNMGEIHPVACERDTRAADGRMSSLAVDGVRIEMIERGRGRPLLFLHPGIGLSPGAPVLDRLAERARVIAPLHPGFGGSDQPASFTCIDDLAYFYLDLM